MNRLRRHAPALLAGLLFSAFALADTPPAELPDPITTEPVTTEPVTTVSVTPLTDTLFINDATVYTMSSRGVLRGADILVRDGRIAAIGPQLETPAGAKVIDAGRRPVTPGFFAGVSALGLVEISAVAESVDNALAAGKLRSEFDVSTAFNPRSALIDVTRIEGYSWTVLGADRAGGDAQDAGTIMAGRGQAALLSGSFDALTGDKVLFIDVGSDAAGQSSGSRAAQWMLLEQAMEESAGELQGSPDALLTAAGRRVLAAYRDAGIVVFDVDRASDILQVMEFSRRHGLLPVISGGAEAWVVADRLAEAGVPVLLNALDNLPRDFDQLGARLDSAAMLHQAGVLIAFGGAGTHQARKLRQVAGNAVANGLRYEAALEAMTVNPARIFGLSDDMGTLEEGKRADLVIWSGDPLEVTSAADQVVIGGKPIAMVSRQTLLRDRYLPPESEWPRAYIKP